MGHMVALIALALASSCSATTYYVAPGGDDTGPGTIDQPWATQNKIRLMQAGDTLLFREGTYRARWAPLVSVGTPTAPITIGAFPGERVVWENTAPRDYMLEVFGQWYVIDGIEFTGALTYGVFISENHSDLPCEHNVIRNCKFYGSSDYCDMIKVHGNATRAAKYVTIDNCEFWGKCANFIDVTGEYVDIRGCYFHDYVRGNQEQAVQIKGGTIGNRVHDSVFLRCEPVTNEVDWWSAAVVDLGGGMDPGTQRTGRPKACSDTHVYNNLIVGGNNPGVRLRDTLDCTVTNNTIVLNDSTPPNSYGPLAPIIVGNTSERTVIRNNVLVNDRPRMLMVFGNGPKTPSVGSRTLVSDHNLFWYTGASPSCSWLPAGAPSVDWLTGGDEFPYVRSYLTVALDAYRALSGQDAHSIVADPLFADPANGDYHLKSEGGRWTPGGWVYDTVTSPAIDAGDPTSDYSGEPGPNGGRVNLGAYGNTPQASKT